MKTFIQTLFFFLLVTQICFGQWYQQNSGTNKNLYAVQFIDDNTGFAVGDSGTILRTTDAGNNWLIQPSETTLPLNDIFFVDANNGWIAGGVILKTTNGGTTWLNQSEDSIFAYSGIFFTDLITGWIVGDKIWKTTDGGNIWIEDFGAGWHSWFDVSFKNLDTGIVVGFHIVSPREVPIPATVRTSDGGISWTFEDFPHNGTGTLSGICTPSSNTVFVVGGVTNFGGVTNYGIIGKTSDWGTTWLTENIEGPPFNDAYLTDEITGWVVGVNRIFRTTDGGINWTLQLSDTLNVFNGVYFTDVSNGWVVGDKGAIFHTTNGGVSFVEEEQIDEISTEFLISQNYPNPFNPSTRIKYQVSSISHVSLVVYDILGNEIETLVNEEKPAGTYELTWIAVNLPSGVYFYQLKACSIVETKKMLLLK